MPRPLANSRREVIPDSDEEEADATIVPEGHSYLNTQGVLRQAVDVLQVPVSPVKTGPRLRVRNDSPLAGDTDGIPVQLDDDAAPVYDLLAKEPRKRKTWNPLAEWVRKKKPQRYLDEIVGLEGRGQYQGDVLCIACDEPGLYRCRDCFTDALYCKVCLVRAHSGAPLHRIERWCDGMFERTSLKTLGLRIQLGHAKAGHERRPCRNPKPAVDDDFVIVDTHGIHEVHVDFCDCEIAEERDVQLLRARLYPATSKHPRTAATFGVLRHFHLMTLTSKCSGSEFYKCLARETNNSGTERVRDRYNEFLLMTREWRYLQMLKRALRAHDPTGVDGTKDGECALLCPACPQPGKNLPPDWKNAPKEKKFLYALYLALDANFRMRRKKVSSEENDPSLGDGWSFFVNVSMYYAYLAEHWKTKQPRSTCVAHDAVDKPDRESRGTAGERYINMDYLFFTGLAGSEVVELYVSYDIACQWHKNIWARMTTLPEEVRFVKGKKYCVFLIPKFHLPAHIEACNILFSFNLTRWVGMTDGEAPERGWAMLNPLATATAEMGPGMRRDTINDAVNDMNHEKIISLGEFSSNELMACLIMATVELEELEASLLNLGAGEALESWRETVEAWEEDSTKENPFAAKVERTTVVNVRREMALEVQAELDQEQLDGLAVSDEMHGTELIGMGLQLEELQRQLGMDMARIGNHPSVDQQANMTERANKLRRKLLTWMDAQVLVTPHVALLRAEEDRAQKKISATQAQPGTQVHHMALWLPSAIKGRVECDMELYEYEFRLRLAQAHEALDDVRHHLLYHTHLYKFKDRFARGVKANTRSQTKIQGVEERILREAERYRAARRALESLGRYLEKRGWEADLRPLLPADVRGMPRALFQDPIRKKMLMKKGPDARKKAAELGRIAKERMSWIWRSAGAKDEDGGGMNEALRIEWLKTRARYLRHVEQIDLLEEERRRILQFLQWRADTWEGSANKRPAAPASEADRDPAIVYAPKQKWYAEGNIAYAKRQASLLRKLRSGFEEKWEDVDDIISMGRTAIGVVETQPAVDADDIAGEEEGHPDEREVVPIARHTVPLEQEQEEDGDGVVAAVDPDEDEDEKELRSLRRATTPPPLPPSDTADPFADDT
ncbi:hypothetical protein C8R47DRAFT_1218538 [Mycena vitilis]|nr:hypothetical protein C8R47DRAFT_1218538 [Mycena vitilis]